MSWPTGTIATTALDADTDSPLLARPAIKETADKVNEIVANGEPLLKATYTAADILSKLKTVDGPTSGIDAQTAANADTIDGFHASQSPDAGEVLVLDANGRATVSNGTGISQLRPNGDILASRGANEGLIYLNEGGTRFFRYINELFQIGYGALVYNLRHDANTFHGRVSSSGVVTRLPTGWTASAPSAGIIEIVHSLNHQNYTVSPSSVGNTGGVSIQWQVVDNNKFRIYCSVNSHISFTMLLD